MTPSHRQLWKPTLLVLAGVFAGVCLEVIFGPAGECRWDSDCEQQESCYRASTETWMLRPWWAQLKPYMACGIICDSRNKGSCPEGQYCSQSAHDEPDVCLEEAHQRSSPR
jgi:hypothetical protein